MQKQINKNYCKDIALRLSNYTEFIVSVINFDQQLIKIIIHCEEMSKSINNKILVSLLQLRKWWKKIKIDLKYQQLYNEIQNTALKKKDDLLKQMILS